jgi:hypothetical protein
MISQVASQLLTSGSSLISAGQKAAGLSGQLYTALVPNDTTQSANIGKAMASLAATLNGKTQTTLGSTPITIGSWCAPFLKIKTLAGDGEPTRAGESAGGGDAPATLSKRVSGMTATRKGYRPIPAQRPGLPLQV